MFAFYFSKGAGSVGNLMIGRYDLQRFARENAMPNDIVWTGLAEGDGWTIPMGGVKFRGAGSNLDLKGSQLTLDTGLTYALVPPDDLDAIARSLKDQMNMTCTNPHGGDLDMYECACSEAQYKKLVPLQFIVNSKMFNLPVKAWMSYTPPKQ